MKKARIMLTAIIVIGGLGGTLVIKAKAKVGGRSYWTTTVFGATNGWRLDNAKTTAAGHGNYRYYTLENGQHAYNSGYITTTSI